MVDHPLWSIFYLNLLNDHSDFNDFYLKNQPPPHDELPLPKE